MAPTFIMGWLDFCSNDFGFQVLQTDTVLTQLASNALLSPLFQFYVSVANSSWILPLRIQKTTFRNIFYLENPVTVEIGFRQQTGAQQSFNLISK